MKMIWVSICSAHKERDYNCFYCNCGRYEYEWKLKFESFFATYFKSLWLKYINRGKQK